MPTLTRFVHGCITLIVFPDNLLLERLSIYQDHQRFDRVRFASYVKYALVLVIAQALIVPALLEQLPDHLHIIF